MMFTKEAFSLIGVGKMELSELLDQHAL